MPRPSKQYRERMAREKAELEQLGLDEDALVERILNGDHESVYNEVVAACESGVPRKSIPRSRI